MTTLDGRRVMTRTDLMAAYGLGRSTLEKWFRERGANGHPEPVGTVGGQHTWDAEEWAAWYAARRSAPKVPPGLLSREELATRFNLTKHRLKQLWADREANGHPAPAHQSGKALYWDAEEWRTWHETLPEPKPDEGDPDDLVTLAEAARILGLAQTSVTVYPKRPPAGWPEPVKVEPLGGGRVRRFYRRGDIQAYAARSRS
ncbi:hypothetical protein GCM10009678_49730 [Actinomadura kijaniata]|uniref:Putative DNA-binding transcriptional regulator AlpA n=1 Tax=Actinomadura namibiensis TaxID=182080 RepID=A0A7W3LNV0_ACTNM|nr:hypothetical protein [Actinomadura namibiensis]MBA8951549.1 putative DNA-binding transcriptional regulator AlpA [Actinomadura namibiensis]